MYRVTYTLYGAAYDFRQMTRQQALHYATDVMGRGAVDVVVARYA